MIIRKLKSMKEITNAALDVILGRYPSFVYGLVCSPEIIPIFTFHNRIEPKRFEAQLAFLKENGYWTLTCDELLKILKRERGHSAKEVMLTFDDGWKSLWSVAFPLLKKYGFQGTAFVVPGRIPDADSFSPNLDDVWEGTFPLSQLPGLHGDTHDLANWREISRMHQSGVIDIQSHTLSHSLMFVSSQIVDFVNPGLIKTYCPTEVSHLGEDLMGKGPSWGYPLYRSASRMGEGRRYFGDSGLRQACVDCVAERGGKEFFQDHTWRRRLLRVVREYRRKHGNRGLFESDTQRADAMRRELLDSKRILEQRLPGKQVEHLCYPWGEGSKLAVTLSQEVGYKMNFWCHVNKLYVTNVSTNPYYVARMSEVLLFMLPGARRLSLLQIVAKRFVERLSAGSSFATH